MCLPKRSQTAQHTLILSANDLIGVLNDRREAIVELLNNVTALSKELSGLVADNEKVLAPTLQKLNSVTAMLEKKPRQHRQGAAGPGQIPDHPGRGRRERLLLRGIRLESPAVRTVANRSWTTHSVSGGVSTPDSRPIPPAHVPNLPPAVQRYSGRSTMTGRKVRIATRGGAGGIVTRRCRVHRPGLLLRAEDDHRVLRQRHGYLLR